MGKVIPRSASPERIFADFDESLKRGRLKGGEVKKTVEARIGPLEAGVAKAAEDVAADKAAVDELDDVLFSLDGGSDLEVGAVLDEVWNVLGRPASSAEYTLIAGRGKAQWTDGDPRKQPLLMTILASRLRQSTAFALQNGKEGWAQRIEAKATPQQQVATKLEAVDAKLSVSTGVARGVADIAQVALVRLKRDFQNIGLTEAQIHEIIPDYEPKPKKSTGDGKDDKKSAGDGKDETTTTATPAAPSRADS
ncbi:Hypothetical protein A7982_11952 [Minicystis rosea]|nr:Hypothetical protein A7982_11952 [Minicystis rosea]